MASSVTTELLNIEGQSDLQLLQVHDLDDATGLYSKVRIQLQKQGIMQWPEDYPNRDLVAKDIASQMLYGFRLNGNWIGLICISAKEDENYMGLNWQFSGPDSIAVHRLAVLPKFQKQGLGSLMMKRAEQLAKRKNKLAIRLDTWSGNRANVEFYKKRGYQSISDTVYYPPVEGPFICFELKL